MVDDADALELAEDQVTTLIRVLHKQLNYWQILKIFLTTCLNLQMLADLEWWAKQRE